MARRAADRAARQHIDGQNAADDRVRATSGARGATKRREGQDGQRRRGPLPPGGDQPQVVAFRSYQHSTKGAPGAPLLASAARCRTPRLRPIKLPGDRAARPADVVPRGKREPRRRSALRRDRELDRGHRGSEPRSRDAACDDPRPRASPSASGESGASDGQLEADVQRPRCWSALGPPRCAVAAPRALHEDAASCTCVVGRRRNRSSRRRPPYAQARDKKPCPETVLSQPSAARRGSDVERQRRSQAVHVADAASGL